MLFSSGPFVSGGWRAEPSAPEVLKNAASEVFQPHPFIVAVPSHVTCVLQPTTFSNTEENPCMAGANCP